MSLPDRVGKTSVPIELEEDKKYMHGVLVAYMEHNPCVMENIQVLAWN